MPRMNFGRNLLLNPAADYTPRTEQDVLRILERHRGQQIRCCGRLHSWSRILEADQVLLDMRCLNSVHPELHEGQPSVRVGGGCQIKDLLRQLRQTENWTLPSVGFITEQTVAGAISTGTHGSGRNSLSHYVLSLRVARYDAGSGRAIIVEIDAGDELRAARCGLGCLGVIISVRMKCRETYRVEEHFQEYHKLDDVLQAEQRYPLQQFYLLPWRWTYFVQHRRETTESPSRLAWVYHWYRHIVFSRAMSRQCEARLHWGKLHPLSPAESREHYPRFSEFQAICQAADPESVFQNGWTRSLVIAERQNDTRSAADRDNSEQAAANVTEPND
jgi:hypothetical protein